MGKRQHRCEDSPRRQRVNKLAQTQADLDEALRDVAQQVKRLAEAERMVVTRTRLRDEAIVLPDVPDEVEAAFWVKLDEETCPLCRERARAHRETKS
jgi:hypothetical protein